jgi:hypothetical protein
MAKKTVFMQKWQINFEKWILKNLESENKSYFYKN